MRYLLLLSTIFLIGCAATKYLCEPLHPEDQPYRYPTAQTFDASYDQTWDCLITAIAESPIKLLDKSSGLIHTESVHTLKYDIVRVNRGIVFGGIVHDERPTDVRYSLKINVKELGADSVLVDIIRTVFYRPRVAMYGKGKWLINDFVNYQRCPSDTQTEHRILNQIHSCLNN